VRFGKSIEQTDADCECELLASDCVDEALEEGREPRRFQPAEACGECVQELRRGRIPVLLVPVKAAVAGAV
jgi:hypothetical protein